MIAWIAVWGFFKLLLVWLGAPSENYYNAANRLFAARDFRQAELLYQRVWQNPPRQLATDFFRREPTAAMKFKAAYNAGNAAYFQGNWAKAVEDYEAALRFDPVDEDAWHNLELAQARLKGRTETQAETNAELHPPRDRETAVMADIFTLPPAALAEAIQTLTRAGYPFRPGSSLKAAPAPAAEADVVDW